MDDDKKCQLIADMLADKGLQEGEGIQRLAHAMIAPIRENLGKQKSTFVYKKPEPGWRERSYANGLRRMANERGGSPLLERMASAWDAYAEEIEKMPAWKRKLIRFLERLFK